MKSFQNKELKFMFLKKVLIKQRENDAHMACTKQLVGLSRRFSLSF